MRLIPALILSISMASPAFALVYPCPADPGFCYFDAGNDGCFDPPTDAGPIDADLEAGTYPDPGPPVAGSIVCPPTVRKLNPTSPIDWSTATGGDILMYGVQIKGDFRADIRSGGELHFDGRMIVEGKLTMEGDGDVSIDGRLVSRGDQLFVESQNGGITLASRTNIKAENTAWVRTYNGGDIVAGDKCKLKSKDGAPSIISDGDATTSNVFMQGGGGVSISGHDVTMLGRSTMQALRDNDFGNAEIRANDGGHAQVVWLIASGRAVIIDVGSAEVGLPFGGEVRRSKIKATRGSISIFADGPIVFDHVAMTTPQESLQGLRITTDGTQVDILGSSVKAGLWFIDAPAPGSACDITGTTWKNLTPDLDCDTVVGP